MRRGLVAGLICGATWGALVGLACGGSSGTGLFGGQDGAPGDAPNVTADATRADAEGGSPPPSDTRIDPLDVGRSWVFDVEPLDGGIVSGGCTAGVVTTSVLGPGPTIDGSASVRYQPLCDAFLVDAVVEGDRVTGYPVDAGFTPGVIVDGPVQEGHTWQYAANGPTFIWHDAGVVTVPAGTFTDCWARAYVTQSQAQFIYCRAVGLVAVVDTDFGYRALLTSKNF
jgi:hypothetical protein